MQFIGSQECRKVIERREGRIRAMRIVESQSACKKNA